MQKSIILSLATLTLFAGAASGDYGAESINEIGDESSYYSRPVVRCISGGDCAANECSLMGMQRYSMPECTPRRALNETCIPGRESDSKLLSFPHATYECDDVYTLVCPCLSGLTCDLQLGVCKKDKEAPKEQQQQQQSEWILPARW